MNCHREKAGLSVDDEQEYLPLSWLSQADYSGNGKYCFLRMGIIHDSAAISRSMISKFAQSFYEISLR